MGLCLPCLGGAAEDVVETPDPEMKRQQLLEAAEKRQREATNRGIRDPQSVAQKKKKKEEVDNAMCTPAGGEGGLRWQVG
ncbi:hypothetical protein GDO86_008867 [Hymenochirus boettgeri]|uniref:Small VCP/p97-interacting protein n=1 Tax=Hymenochirus boettgeri TaxID=247094 RepID=A0A8T2J241_9PIPI|nr:hypothetical protein GDO86_008867 [Hymenochirus boettgeri]